MSKKKAALGKGLSALLADPHTDITSSPTNTGGDHQTTVAGSISKIPVENIETNPFQPRTHFEKDALEELAQSIREHGIIQPITVRKMGYDQYQLISGERRFRASQMAGLTEIPAFIRVTNDQEMLEMALVENIQRENLDAIEVALSYQRLIDECNLTQEELSAKVAKKRATVTNYLRLLKLPAEIQLGIRGKKLSMGHARSLVSIEDDAKQLEIFRQVIDKSLSVRQTEELVRNLNNPDTSSTTKSTNELNSDHVEMRRGLTSFFGTKVDLTRSGAGSGKITINFSSDHELARIMELLEN